ncbi:MAG: hypothetical protein RIK87_08600 [Fuerstiella sp.]
MQFSVKQQLIVALIAALVCSPTIAAEEEIREVLQTWRQQQQRFHAVRFKISGTLTRPDGYTLLPAGNDYKNLVPASAESEQVAIESTLLFDFTHGRLRRHLIKASGMWVPEENAWRSFPFDQVVTYEGTQWQSYTPHELNLAKAALPDRQGTELAIYSNQPRRIVFDVEHIPLLIACGMIRTVLVFEPHDFTPAINDHDFRLDGRHQLDENQCLVLRTIPDPMGYFFEYWVDIHDHRMIRRMMTYKSTDPPKLRLNTSIEYSETEHGPLPKNWRVEKADFMTDKVSVYQVSLDEFEANPILSDSDFQIAPPPGTRVHDERRPRDSRDYVVMGAGEPELPVGEFEARQEQRKSRFALFAGLAIVMFLVAGAVVVLRRRRSS